MKESAVLPVSAPVPAEAVEKPKPASAAETTSRLNRSFASIPAASPAGDGRDDGREEALGLLAQDLAAKLGIRTEHIRIRMDSTSQRLLEARGAQGLVQDGVIHLNPRAFQPASREGRRIVAHEVAHVAQARLPGASSEIHTRIPAEIEAEVFARQYVATRSVTPIRVALAPATAAADNDFESLVLAVAKSRDQEIARIVSLLSYGIFDWAITDGDVFDVLQILAMYSMVTARAMARAIGPKYRGRFFSNLSPAHYAKYRTEILAVAWAVESEKEFASEKYEILNLVSLKDLEGLEAVAVAEIAALSPKVVAATSVTNLRRVAEAQEFANSDKGQAAAATGLKEANVEEKAEAAKVEAAKVAKSQAIDKLAARITDKLHDLIVTDKEALALLDAVADVCLPYSNPANQFQALAVALTTKPLDDLIEQIPAQGLYQTERRRKAYVYLVATRPPFKNEQIAENLMSSPWWQFWDTVTSEEAFLAYLLVRSMPQRARAAFLKARGGEKWGAIIAELPRNIRESASFNFYDGGPEQKDRQPLLAELLDDTIWTVGQVSRLDATIRMALAAGEAQFVFEQSKVHHADKVPGLDTLVEKYQLYLEGKRTSYEKTEKALEGKAWYEEGILGRLAGAYRFLVLLFGLKNVQIFGVRMAADINLNSLHDYGGVPTTGDTLAPMVSGARFHEATSAEKKEQAKTQKEGELGQNALRVEKLGRGELIASATKLLIDQLSLVGETTVTASPVALAGFRFAVSYNPETFKPIGLEAGFDELTLSNCAIVKGDAIYSINQLKLTHLRLRISNEDRAATEDQDGLGAMFAALLDPQHATGVRFAFDLLQMQGVATSSGTFAETVEIAGLALQAGGNASAYLDTLRGSLQRLNRRIEEEMKAAQDDPAHAAEHDKARGWIEQQAAKVLDEIKKGQPHGSVVDIRSIKVSGLRGLTDEPILLNDIHGQGQSVTAVVPLFADPTSIRNMIRGSETAPTLKGKLPGEEEFNISIRDIKADKPVRLTGGIPTAQSAKAELTEFDKENGKSRFKESYQAVHDELERRALEAAEYETLAARGIQNLSPLERERFAARRRSLLAFEERRAVILDTLSIEGISLNISGSGNPEMTAAALSATGIHTFTADGRENLHIGSITGQNVGIGATFAGGLANAKDWRKNLESATFMAGNLTLKDIRHAGSAAAIEELIFAGEQDANGLEATLTAGDSSTGGASLHLQSRRIVAKGVSVPTQAALLRAELERLDHLDPDGRSTEEEKRRALIIELLHDLDDIEAKKKAAEAIAATSKSPAQKTAAHKQIARSDQALKNWQDRLVVNKLTIEFLDLSISGLGDVLKEGYDFDKDATGFTVEGGGKDKHLFERVAIEGVRSRGAKGDQVLAEKIEVGPTALKFEKRGSTYVLEGLNVGSISVLGVSYVSGETKVQSVGESKLVGITVDASFTEDKEKEESSLTITRLRIDRIVADQLKYEDADKSVTVQSGELLGLGLSNMHVTLPKDPAKKTTIEGAVTLDAVKKLTLGAVASGYAANVTLNAPQPQGTEAHALSVGFAKNGAFTVALRGLSADAHLRQLGTQNGIHVEWKNISGSLIKNGDSYEVKGLTIGNLTLSEMHWQVGQKTISIDDKVTLSGISIDAEAALQTKQKGPGSKLSGEKEEPEKVLSKLLIKRVVVDEIVAKSVTIKMPAVGADDTRGIEASDAKSFELQEASIRGLTITGFDVLKMQGKVEVTKSVSVTNLKSVIGDEAHGAFKKATTSLKIFGKDAEEPGKGGRELSATLYGKDGTLIRLGRTDSINLADILLSSKKKVKGVDQETRTKIDQVSLAGITTGDLIVRDDLVSLAEIEIAGPVEIANVDWNVTGASNQRITMDLATLPEPITIDEVWVDFKQVTTGKMVGGKEQTRYEADKVSVSNVSIPKIVATKLHYHGPLEAEQGTSVIDLDLPTARIEGISIRGLSKDFSKNLLSLDAGVKSASATGVVATLTDTIGTTIKKKTFGANISTGEIHANVLYKTTNAGGDTEKTDLIGGAYELDSVSLRNITGTFEESGKKTQRIGNASRFSSNLSDGSGLDLANIHKDASKTTIGRTSLRGFTYDDPNLGLHIDLEELLVPNTVTIPETGPITLPAADVTNAFFRVDDLNALGSGDKPAGEPSTLDAEQFWGILDHIDGNFIADVYTPIYLALGRDLRQDVFHVDLPIRNGKFNYEDAWSNAVWLRNRALASLTMDSDATIQAGKSTRKDMSKSYLALQVFGSNLVTWTPGDKDERKELLDDKLVQLKRIARPDDKDTPAEKEKKRKEKEQDKRDGKPEHVNPSAIELRNVDAHLGVKGYIPLDLGATGKIGLGTRGGNAVTDLALASETTSKLLWSLERMAVTVDELNFGGTTLKGTSGGGAEIRIGKVTDGSITFDGGKLLNPKTLEGTITQASVTNLSLERK